MPRRNRVTPFGEIIATPERGTFLGNRGILHDEESRILRDWRLRRWILCLLEFKRRKRMIMAPNCYTELFFLDEATGLAAGHRPCAECRRGRFVAFRHAWVAGNSGAFDPGRASAPAIDDRLHAERIGTDGSKRTFPANIDDLPDGVFVARRERAGLAYLIWGGNLLLWSPAGYRERGPRPRGEVVSVLTPRSTVNAIRAGYVPEIHSSARRS